jgi:hypothetical protein
MTVASSVNLAAGRCAYRRASAGPAASNVARTHRLFNLIDFIPQSPTVWAHGNTARRRNHRLITPLTLGWEALIWGGCHRREPSSSLWPAG